MKLLIILICTIIVFLTIYFKISDKIEYNYESFNTSPSYIIYRYVPTYLERNPLVCYVSHAEAYIDKSFFEQLSLELPLKITTKENMKYRSDLAILPESILLQYSTKDNNFEYNYLSYLKNMSFFLLQFNNINSEITDFTNIENKHIYIKGNGYVSVLFTEIFKYLNITPKITYYNTESEAIKALQNNECDAIACLLENPNLFIFDISYKYLIKIIPWNLNSMNYDILGYYLRGLKRTKIDLARYKYSELKTELNSAGFTKDLLINKNLSNEIVELITRVVFKPKGILRSNAVQGSYYINFHPRYNKLVKKKGLISITNKNEDPSCVLLAGKSPCVGDNAKFAKHIYDKTFWGSKLQNDQTMLSFLKKTYNNKNKSNNYNKYNKYNKILENSNICFEDVKIKDKETCEKKQYHWDKPCLFNDDCPFYKSNTNYPNEFGKCIDGFCEMPLGIERKGFRKYESKALCHNCPFENPFCCTKNKLMSSPDIAFANDRLERLKNKKELNARKIIV